MVKLSKHFLLQFEFFPLYPLVNAGDNVPERSEYINLIYIPSVQELNTWKDSLAEIGAWGRYDPDGTCDSCQQCQYKPGELQQMFDDLFNLDSDPFLSIGIKRDLSTIKIEGHLGFAGVEVDTEIPFTDYSGLHNNPRNS